MTMKTYRSNAALFVVAGVLCYQHELFGVTSFTPGAAACFSWHSGAPNNLETTTARTAAADSLLHSVAAQRRPLVVATAAQRDLTDGDYHIDHDSNTIVAVDERVSNTILNMDAADSRRVVLRVLLSTGAATAVSAWSFPGEAIAAASGVAEFDPLTEDDKDYSDYTTTESGLRYKTMVQPATSTNQTPKRGEKVVFVYTLWLYKFNSNRLIASSRTRMKKFKSYSDGTANEPTSFRIGDGRAMVPGLEEGISTMSVGERRRIMVPPSLAFGPKGGAGGIIPPNMTMFFDVELLGIQP